MDGEAGPEYQRLMRLIRARIISGEYPVGQLIPSTTELVADSKMSRPVVRRAIDQLKAEGILEGHQGKGVYAAAMPSVADRRRDDAETIGKQLTELADQVADYPDLRARVGVLEANLMYLYSQLGHDYPHGGRHDNAEEAPRRGRARR